MNKKLSKKTISIKKLNKIYGGKFKTTFGGTVINSYGCTISTLDTFNDVNGDGVMNNDEWKTLTACTIQDCP